MAFPSGFKVMCRFRLLLLFWLFLSASLGQAGDRTLRAEVRPLDYGAELVTIFVDIPAPSGDPRSVPLVSLLRDTLGDSDPENDLLRYFWLMTYTEPAPVQRLFSFIPFFYHGAKSKDKADGPPPQLLDLASPKQEAWQKILILALQNLLLDPQGLAFRAVPRAGMDNHYNYKASQIALALSVLALYRLAAEQRGEAMLTEAEWRQIQAHLLNQHLLGFLLDTRQLNSLYQKEQHRRRRDMARNWELLRQRAEEEHLYFEPLLGEGSAHIVLWAAREDIRRFYGLRRFNSRFLNIKSPWRDRQLLEWQGYSKTIYLDGENRRVTADHPQAQSRELIPLAVYGLDSPHLPLLLIDFRNSIEPKKREVSKRASKDLFKYMVDVFPLADLHYFLARKLFGFLAERKGLSLVLPPAFRSYAQLKLALLLEEKLDAGLKQLMLQALDRAQVNPLSNQVEAEVKLALDQYRFLLEYAGHPDGLKKRLQRDREWEMSKLEHGRASLLFKLGRYCSFGLYRHNEGNDAAPQRRYSLARKLKYHSRLLGEVAESAEPLGVSWDLEKVKRSLEIVSQHSELADPELAAVVAKIHRSSSDPEVRRISGDCLLAITGRIKERTRHASPALSSTGE